VAGDRVAGGEHSGAEHSGAGPIGLRASQLLALEFGSKAEFDDPRLEWRRLFSEMLGTFLLVLVAAGGAIVHALGQISLAAAVVAPGLMVMAIILFMGAVSGAHLNPAVSIAFALRRDFPWNRLPGYVLVQLVGASLACLFLDAVFGNVHHLGATLPGPGYAAWQALLLEVVLTAGLVSVVLGTASAAQNVGAIAALGVGGYIALAGLWSAPVSGASMNPARSFGPALVSGDFGSYWVYVAGPIAGAFIAVGCAWVLRGGGGDPTSYAAGSGRLGVNALREGRRLSWKLMHDAAAPLRVERSHGSADPSPGAPEPAPGEAAPAPGAEEPAPESPGANEPPPS
jgi:aquaporin Z